MPNFHVEYNMSHLTKVQCEILCNQPKNIALIILLKQRRCEDNRVKKITMMQQQHSNVQRSTADLRRRLTNLKILVSH